MQSERASFPLPDRTVRPRAAVWSQGTAPTSSTVFSSYYQPVLVPDTLLLSQQQHPSAHHRPPIISLPADGLLQSRRPSLQSPSLWSEGRPPSLWSEGSFCNEGRGPPSLQSPALARPLRPPLLPGCTVAPRLGKNVTCSDGEPGSTVFPGEPRSNGAPTCFQAHGAPATPAKTSFTSAKFRTPHVEGSPYAALATPDVIAVAGTASWSVPSAGGANNRSANVVDEGASYHHQDVLVEKVVVDRELFPAAGRGGGPSSAAAPSSPRAAGAGGPSVSSLLGKLDALLERVDGWVAQHNVNSHADMVVVRKSNVAREEGLLPHDVVASTSVDDNFYNSRKQELSCDVSVRSMSSAPTEEARAEDFRPPEEVGRVEEPARTPPPVTNGTIPPVTKGTCAATSGVVVVLAGGDHDHSKHTGRTSRFVLHPKPCVSRMLQQLHHQLHVHTHRYHTSDAPPQSCC